MSPSPAKERIVPRRRPGRWLAAACVLVALALLANAFASAKAINWSVVGRFISEGVILEGLRVTIELAIVAQIGACVMGVLVALARLSSNPVLNSMAYGYQWFFRGVPLLVQLILIYNLALVFPTLGIGIPFTPLWWSADTNAVITGFSAAIIGMSLADGAVMSEVIRAGILSVPQGQRDAARAMGLSSAQTMWRIILPQSMPFIIPPTGNNFLALLKATSLVSVIAGSDLLTNAQAISARTYQVIEMLLVATFWYLVLVSLATLGQHWLERYFARSQRDIARTAAERA